MRDYTKIQAWQFADDLTVTIYEATKHFPKDEQWSLTNQLRRAAYSVPANIVEGSSRNTQKDYLHFLYIARGSLNETAYFIHLSQRLGYLTLQQAQALTEDSHRAGRILTGLIQSVEKECGSVTKTIAKLTSLLVLSLATWTMAKP